MRIEDTMTITEAVTLLGVRRQSVHNAIKAGKIKVLAEVAGRKLLSRTDVERYKPRGKQTVDGAEHRRTERTAAGDKET